jgi:tetratricopeptide (TPR) repeat protein
MRKADSGGKAMRFPFQGGQKRRLEALRLLAQKDSPEVVEPLLSAVASVDPVVEEAAMGALSSLRNEQALDRLISLAPRYAKEVAEVLFRRGQAAIPKIGPLVRSDDPVIQAWAVDMLRRIESPQGQIYLKEALLSPQALVRAAAAVALAERGQAREELLDLLRFETDTWAKCQLIDAVAQAGLEEAAPLLEEALRQLADLPLPWDARTRLWQSLIRDLKALGYLEKALRQLAFSSTASLKRWLDIPVTLGDVEALCLTFYYSVADRREVLAALERARRLHGQESIVQGLAKAMAQGQIPAEIALQIVRGLYVSGEAARRLLPELSALGQQKEEPVRQPAFSWADLQARLSELFRGVGQIRWPAGDQQAMQARLGELIQGLAEPPAPEAPPTQPEEVVSPSQPAPAQPAAEVPEPPIQEPMSTSQEPPTPPPWREAIAEATDVLAQLPPAETFVPPSIARRLNGIVERKLLPEIRAAAEQGEASLLSFLSRLVDAAPASLLASSPCLREPLAKALWARAAFERWALESIASSSAEKRASCLALLGWVPHPGLQPLLLEALQDSRRPVRTMAVNLLAASLAREAGAGNTSTA